MSDNSTGLYISDERDVRLFIAGLIVGHRIETWDKDKAYGIAKKNLLQILPDDWTTDVKLGAVRAAIDGQISISDLSGGRYRVQSCDVVGPIDPEVEPADVSSDSEEGR